MCHLWIEQALQRGSPCKKCRVLHREGRVSSPLTFLPLRPQEHFPGLVSSPGDAQEPCVVEGGPFREAFRSPLVPSPISW